MIAWIVARYDWPERCRLLVYKLPKKILIYGPMLIDAMIDQTITPQSGGASGAKLTSRLAQRWRSSRSR